MRLSPEREMAVLCATNIGDKNRGHAVSINEKLNDVACAVIREALREDALKEDAIGEEALREKAQRENRQQV